MTACSFSNTADQILIAANPRSGSCEHASCVRKLETALRQAGFGVEVCHDLEALAVWARRLHASGRLRVAIAAGGDGTVAELVNRTEPGTPISVYPLGTANLLATYLGITADPREMTRVVSDGATIQLDAGRANGRLFLLMVGCGFDADVVERLHRHRNGHIHYWSYAKPILESIRNYQYPELRITCYTNDGQSQSKPLRARWAFAVNLPCYAAGLKIVPQAVGTDGLLHVCTFDKGSFWNGLRYLGHVVLRHHVWLSECTTVTCQRVRIESDRQVPYQLDGDPGGYLPVEIEVLRDRLTLVAPSEFAARLNGAVSCAAIC